MNKNLSIVTLTLLFLVGIAAQAFSATIVATPSNVPKGAYVNGPGGQTDDNFFFQKIVLTSAADHGAGTVAITLPEGMTIADVDGDANVQEEISLTGSVAGFAVNAATTASIITLDVPAAVIVGSTVTIMIPVVTGSAPADSTQDYYAAFAGTGVATDNIANGSGYFITYVDPAPKAINLVAFAANMVGNNDSTNAKGDKYPTTPANTHGALPDLILDGVNQVISANAGIIGYGLNGAENGNETTFTVWISTDSTLAHVDSLTAGVFQAVRYSTLAKYIQSEGGTGNIQYDMQGYPEGKYYFYITSYITGDFPLARSDALYVRHWPVINAVGWDRNNDGLYTPGAPGTNDDQPVTLDSGGYFIYDGTNAASGSRTYLDIYANVDDLDDNAVVHLFYSTDASLDTTDVIRSGSSADSSLAITGLAGATLIANNLLENSEDAQGFIRARWSVNPDSVGILPSGNYTVYAVVCDGKNMDMLPVKGTATGTLPEIVSGTTSLVTYIKHSPKLKLDVIKEYDTTPGTQPINIDLKSQDQIMISWAKGGVNGDVDIDDAAKIELYIVEDAGNDGLADYGHSDAAALRAAAVASPTVVHMIADNLLEDPEGKDQSWFTWNLKDDTSWNPINSQNYFIYGIIDDQKAAPNNTSIVTTILQSASTFVVAGQNIAGANGNQIIFDNTGFARLSDPPAEGVTINAEEAYRMRFTAFDWDLNANVGIFLVDSLSTGFAAGPLTTDITAISAAENSYNVTSADGTLAAGLWKSEDTHTYFDLQVREPGNLAATYTTQLDAGAVNLADGTYWVYIGIDNNNDDFAEGTEVLYRAPGSLRIVNAGTPASQRNLTIYPINIAVAQNDTINFTIKAADNGMTVDRIDAYIAVEKTWWDLLSPSAPFTAAGGYTGKLLTNTVYDDSTNNRWILRTVVFDQANDFAITDNGIGDNVASFRLVSKGTTDALQHLTSIYYLNEPATGRVTKFSNNGVDITVNTLASSIKIVPRAIVEGIVELEGRNQMNTQFTFELRQRGGYDSITDSLFYATNDADTLTPGIQFTPDIDGKFTFWKVPTGEYDLVVKYDRYLAKKVQINTYPGIDTLFVNFGILRGGDAIGYTDSLGHVYPNNKIDTDDINRIQTAFLSTPANPKWNNGTDNWKWSDVNEDNIVEVSDISMATGNVNTQGAQPVFAKPAAGEPVNGAAIVQFVNIPASVKAGETYTIQVVGQNLQDTRAYFINLNYNKEMLTFAGILKGDFIKSETYSFPVIGDNNVGLVNSILGEGSFSGNGVLAEVSFTAKEDGAFSSDMLGFEEVSVVNSSQMKEEVTAEVSTAVEATPGMFELGQNYPNPFNPTTTISFSVPKDGHVVVKVYDVLGRNVRTLVSNNYTAGKYSVVWDGKDANGSIVSAGMYIYNIESGNFRATKRMMFVK